MNIAATFEQVWNMICLEGRGAMCNFFQVHSKKFDLVIIVKIIYLKFQVVMVYMYDALMRFFFFLQFLS